MSNGVWFSALGGRETFGAKRTRGPMLHVRQEPASNHEYKSEFVATEEEDTHLMSPTLQRILLPA